MVCRSLHLMERGLLPLSREGKRVLGLAGVGKDTSGVELGGRFGRNSRKSAGERAVGGMLTKSGGGS